MGRDMPKYAASEQGRVEVYEFRSHRSSESRRENQQGVSTGGRCKEYGVGRVGLRGLWEGDT